MESRNTKREEGKKGKTSSLRINGKLALPGIDEELKRESNNEENAKVVTSCMSIVEEIKKKIE